MRIFIYLTVFFITISGFSQNLVQDPALIKKELKNGLTYYIYPTDKVEGQGYFRLFVKVGSLQETENQRGLAHFLEHMAFNGIEHFKANELIEFLENKGSKFGHDLNAHTSFEETIYKLKIPTKESTVVDSTLTIMSDWVNGMLLDPIEVEKERGVVLSEWLSKQSPQNQSGQVFLNTLLNNSIYNDRAVIGDTTSLKHFKLEALKAFYNKWYDPSLIAVAVAGDVDAEEIEKAIIQKFSGIPSKFPTTTLGEIPNYKKDSLIIYSDKWIKKTELNYIQLQDVFKDVKTELSYNDYLTRNVLNKLMSARLGKLSFKDAKYKNASINISNYLKSKGVLLATVNLKTESVLEGIGAFNTHFNQMFQYGFTALEIEKVKKTMLSSFSRNLKEDKPISAAGMVDQMYEDFFNGNMIIDLKDEYKLIENYFSKIDSIQILEALKNNKNDSPFQYLLTTNDEELKKLTNKKELFSTIEKFKTLKTEAYQNNFDVPEKLLNNTPKLGIIERIVALPEIDAQEIHFSNGATVVYKKSNASADHVLLAGFRKGGFYALDSTNYLNAQYSAPTISMTGYGDFTREALSHFLAGNSAKIQLLIDKTRSGFFGSSNGKDAKTLFELFYLKATQPRVDSLLFKQLKDASINNISDKPKSDKEKFQEEFKYIIRGKDYTTAPNTKEAMEQGLTSQALIPIYNTFFGGINNYVVTIISDKDLEVILPFIKTYIGGMPKGDFDNSFKYKPLPIKKKAVNFIKYGGDSPKAIFSLIFQQDKKLKDLPSLEIQNEILESVLKLELNKRLREEMGVVYGVSVSVSATKHPVSLSRQTIALVCKPSDVDRISIEIKSILNGIISGDIDFQSDLEKVKTNLITTFNVSKQKNSFWTKSIRDYYFNQYRNWDFVTDYEALVHNVSIKDLQKLTKKYFIKTPQIKAILLPKKN
ncbi:pitrilysin family protein [Polaribacter sp. Q13]|uniref:M16 family metallopeptidase n=1 Tax=Polaribacter sp. Q13 TaxID=2806551 RepID=UPI00193C5AC6|nr:M16 family metallopeptidase [Polaribacter sp. Q13]QVY66869.1 insulinase family protein [Polaribacter sp. Q13]